MGLFSPGATKKSPTVKFERKIARYYWRHNELVVNGVLRSYAK